MSFFDIKKEESEPNSCAELYQRQNMVSQQDFYYI